MLLSYFWSQRLLPLGVIHFQWHWWITFQHHSVWGAEGIVSTSSCRAWIGLIYVPGKLWRTRFSFCANRWELLPIYCAGKSRSRSLMNDDSSLHGRRSSNTVCFMGMWDSKAVISSNYLFSLAVHLKANAWETKDRESQEMLLDFSCTKLLGTLIWLLL